MNSATDFGKIFNRLCHIVALKQDGKLTAAIESIVLTVFAFDTDFAPTTIAEIRDALAAYFGVQPSNREIQEATHSHIASAKMLYQNSTYTLSPHTAAEYQQRVADANELEEQVKREWLSEIADLDFAGSDNWQKSIWDCLNGYMAKAFFQHGAQTIELLDPNIPSSTDDTTSLQSYLNYARSRHCKNISERTLEQAVQRFFTSSSATKTQFAVQLLDGTFTYFALTTDGAVAKYLTERIPPAKIFLDSNFIFGLLDLHDNPQNDVSKDLSIVSSRMICRLRYITLKRR